MVSQPEHSRTLALRAPSSVVSRRERRHGRSHAGGTSYAPQNNFPVFTHTGDIEILVSAGGKENRYLLHRLILAQCSGFFEASTSQEWSRATEEKSGFGNGELSRIRENSSTGNVIGSGLGTLANTKKRWRYELDNGSGPDDVPMLVQRDSSATSLFNSDSHHPPPPVRNKPVPASHIGFFRSVANLSLSSNSAPQATMSTLSPEDEDLLRDYDNLFKIFYNYAPSLDAIDIAAAYTQCKSLLSLADMYDALPVIGPRVDHHLLQFQGRLFKQIAKYPPSYLKLAYLARSKTIFKEALIHVVGQWPAGERHLRNTLPDNVLDVVDDKVDELVDMLERVEAKLFRVTLLTSRGERVTPNNSYSDWLVVSLFRQWLVEATNPPPPPPSKSSSSRHNHGSHRHRNDPPPTVSNHLIPQPPPSTQHIIPLTSKPIKMIGTNQTPTTYLTHEECKKFLKMSTSEHYSRDSLKRFERKMDELKGLAAEIVRGEGLMGSGLVVEGAGNVGGYLTCVQIGENDFPWDEEVS